MDTVVDRGGQKKTLPSTLYGRHMLRALAGTLKVAWKAVKDVHAEEFDIDGTGSKGGRMVF